MLIEKSKSESERIRQKCMGSTHAFISTFYQIDWGRYLANMDVSDQLVGLHIEHLENENDIEKCFQLVETGINVIEQALRENHEGMLPWHLLFQGEGNDDGVEERSIARLKKGEKPAKSAEEDSAI